jgi:hypothetical protein
LVLLLTLSSEMTEKPSAKDGTNGEGSKAETDSCA